ncbi:MAG: hypothetical protein Q4E45_09785, partial [Eubacteriales bacterium]|nr:hypothetical protein [Eubacteriales bacterium]
LDDIQAAFGSDLTQVAPPIRKPLTLVGGFLIGGKFALQTCPRGGVIVRERHPSWVSFTLSSFPRISHYSIFIVVFRHLETADYDRRFSDWRNNLPAAPPCFSGRVFYARPLPRRVSPVAVSAPRVYNGSAKTIRGFGSQPRRTAGQ